MKNRGYSYPNRISPAEAGFAVAAFYAGRYPHSTEAEWRRRIEAGQVLLNGLPASPDEILTRGDVLLYHRLSWEEPEAPTDFATLIEDDDILVLSKPSGLPVLPAGSSSRTRCSIWSANDSARHVRRCIGSDAALPEPSSSPATAGLRARWPSYVRAAHPQGLPGAGLGTRMPDAFTVDAPIGPVPYRLPATVNAYRPDGRPSLSHVRVLRRLPDENASILEVTIPTGRPHQIRIHLSYAGCPLVGDTLYRTGGIPRADGLDDEWATTPGATGYVLHSWKIRFPHPARSEEIEVVSPPPTALEPGA